MRYDVSWVEPLDLDRHLDTMFRAGWHLRRLGGQDHLFVVLMEHGGETVDLRAADRSGEPVAERTASRPGSR